MNPKNVVRSTHNNDLHVEIPHARKNLNANRKIVMHFAENFPESAFPQRREFRGFFQKTAHRDTSNLFNFQGTFGKYSPVFTNVSLYT